MAEMARLQAANTRINESGGIAYAVAYAAVAYATDNCRMQQPKHDIGREWLPLMRGGNASARWESMFVAVAYDSDNRRMQQPKHDIGRECLPLMHGDNAAAGK